MNKAQRSGVQGLSRAQLKAVLYVGLVGRRTFAPQYLGAALAFVSKHGVTDMFHVCPYLVRATCFEDTLHEGDIPETF